MSTLGRLLFVLLSISAVFARAQAPEPSTGPAIITNLQRPAMISLDGTWKFQTDPNVVGETEQWFKPGTIVQRDAVAPLPWQLACPDLREYLGVAWYERTFDLPTTATGKRAFIRFESVDSQSKVWVNGQLVGEHHTECTPFDFEITPLVRFGQPNTVTLMVRDGMGMRPWQSEQSIELSGMRGQSWVELRGPVMINDVHVNPDIDKKTAEARIEIGAPAAASATSLTLRVTMKSPDGQPLKQERQIATSAAAQAAITTTALNFEIPDPVLWELDNPKLYEVKAELIDQSGATVDEATTWFGMRKIEARGDKFYLNNHPVYISGGWIDQSPTHGPDEVNWAYPPPYKPLGHEQLIRSIKMAKDLNITTMRRIFRPPDARLVYWADRMGILIRCAGPWIPGPGVRDQKTLAENQRNWSDFVRRHRNSPSMTMLDLFTENAGLNLGDYAGPQGVDRVCKIMYDYVHGLYPSCVLLDNSCGRSMGNHGYTDYHDIMDGESSAWISAWDWFRGFYSNRVDTEASGRLSTATLPPTGIRAVGKPLIASLTSNLTSRIVNADKARQIWGGQKPWWFAAPPHIDTPSSKLTGFDERYTKWGLDTVYGDWNAFTAASDWYQYYGVKFHAEQRRKNPEMAGFFGFLFDCVPHFIGLIDPFLDKKVFNDAVATVYAQDLIIPDPAWRNYWAGESVSIPVHFSHYSTQPVLAGLAAWWVGGDDSLHGEIARGIEMKAGEVAPIGFVRFRAPEVAQPRVLKIQMQLESGGKILSRNVEEIRVFPVSDKQVAAPAPAVNFVGFDNYVEPALRDVGPEWRRFKNLGIDARPGLDPAVGVAVSRVMNPDVEKYMEIGGSVILLAGPQHYDFLSSHGLRLVQPHFSGGINGSLFMHKGRGLCDRVPFENPMCWPFYRALPQTMLFGVKPENNADILSGGYGGFLICKPGDMKTGEPTWGEITATVLQTRYGNGRLIVCTFDLMTHLERDPVATIMFNDLVKLANTCEPQTRLK